MRTIARFTHLLAMLASLIPIHATAQPRHEIELHRNAVVISCSSTEAAPNPACVDRFYNALCQGKSVHLTDGVELDLTGRAPIPVGGNASACSPSEPVPVIESIKAHNFGAVSLTGTRRTTHPGAKLYTRDRADALFTVTADNVRISGLRIIGPDVGRDNSGTPDGIAIRGRANVLIANNEIAGWSGSAVTVTDCGKDAGPPAGCTLRSSRLQPAATVSGNFIHENRHSGRFGYGVVVAEGAYALIEKNAFDFNRHAIAHDGSAHSGFIAKHNLVLRGSGETGFQNASHPFDIHGTGENGFGGIAGESFLFQGNAFQFFAERRFPPGVNVPAINIRATPTDGVQVEGNVFAHNNARNDAVEQTTTAAHFRFSDWTRISIGPNRTDIQTLGKYQVCDMDGDGLDDLVLFTGASVWVSSGGRSAWRYWSDLTQLSHEVLLGRFRGTSTCDVLRVDQGRALVSAGGTDIWRDAGRVDTAAKDLRPFRRAGDARTAVFRRVGQQWQYRFLSGADTAWVNIQTSGYSLGKLRFGDFDGDGGTDVLAVEGGDWSVSWAGQSRWASINSRGTQVDRLVIADFDDDQRDDIGELGFTPVPPNNVRLSSLKFASGGRGPLLPVSVAGLPPAAKFLFPGKFSVGRAPLILVDAARNGWLLGAQNQALKWSEAPY